MYFVESFGVREWLSMCGMIAFSVIGTIIQLFYIFELFKHRENSVMQKHFIVRGKALFFAHCILNLYWSSIHPIIIGLQFIFYPQNMFLLITSYCYGLVLLDLLMLIFCIRCWVLYFNFNYLALQFEKLWKTKLLNDHYNLSWFETHKQLGNPLLLIIIGATLSLILCGVITIPFAYVSQLSNAWYLVSVSGIFLIDIISVFLILKLHSRKSVDNFGMRHELTIFVLVILSMSLIIITPFFMIKDDWIRLWIINIPIHCATLFVNIFQFHNLLHQIAPKTKLLDVRDGNNSYIHELRLIDVLSDSTGINEFARFLIGEFSLEHLLFIIEVSQFRFQFETSNSDYIDKYEYRYQLSDKIPLCATLIDSDDQLKQAQAIRDKFIYKTSPFQINISGTKRKQILNSDLSQINAVETVELKHLFDASYNEVFVLLELDSFKRYLSTSSAASKLAKKIIKKRRRSRGRSREERIKKRVKEKEKKRERRGSSQSLKSPSARAQQAGDEAPARAPNVMTKSTSYSTNTELAVSDNEHLNNSVGGTRSQSSSPRLGPQKMQVSVSFNEEQLADPFNHLDRSGSVHQGPVRNSVLEKNIHNVLHSASSIKCCGC